MPSSENLHYVAVLELKTHWNKNMYEEQQQHEWCKAIVCAYACARDEKNGVFR